MVKPSAEMDRADAIVEFAHVNEQLQRRGLELLRNRNRFHEHTIDDWLEAERALASQPVVEVRRVGEVVEVLADLVDIDPSTLEIEATADTLVITSRAPQIKGRKVFLSIQPPARIAPATVRAEFRDGLLFVTAKVGRGDEGPVRVGVRFQG